MVFDIREIIQSIDELELVIDRQTCAQYGYKL